MTKLSAALAATVLLALIVVLGGCSDVGRAFVVASLDKYRQYHDDEAALAAQAPCAMSVAGYWRAITEDQRRAVDLLCGGPAERPLTRDDALLARDLLRLVERGGQPSN